MDASSPRIAMARGPRRRVSRLDWDSAHFGFAVGCLDGPRASDADLDAALGVAHSDGFRLVYWLAQPDRRPDRGLLDRFGGLLADQRATFAADLGPGPAERARSDRVPAVAIRPLRPGPAPEALVELGVMAGHRSRFRSDPRVPPDRFRALYEQWVERSCRGILADAVLVAVAEDAAVGLITVAARDGIGSIGLLSVHPERRGRGIGAALVRAAHGWFRERGMRRAVVITQLTNEPACRLYQGSGYVLQEVAHHYHFWPRDGAVPGS